VISFNVVKIYRRFGGIYCLHVQTYNCSFSMKEVYISEKDVIFFVRLEIVTVILINARFCDVTPSIMVEIYRIVLPTSSELYPYTYSIKQLSCLVRHSLFLLSSNVFSVDDHEGFCLLSVRCEFVSQPARRIINEVHLLYEPRYVRPCLGNRTEVNS
jgi:hypothetical protein